MRLRNSIFVLVAGALAAGCASGGALAIRGGDKPDWVGGKDPRFGDGVVTGVGLTQVKPNVTSEVLVAEVDAAARADLVKKLRVQVSSEVNSMQSASSAEGDKFSVESRTREVVDAFDLQGAEIVDRWRDDGAGVVWAIATLDKSRMGARLQAQMSDQLRSAEALVAQGDAAVSTDPGAALRHYFGARHQAELANQSAILFRVVTGRSADQVPTATYTAKLTELLSNLELKVADGDGQRLAEHKAASRPIVVSATLTRGGATVPVAGLPLRAELPGGRVESNVSTDPQGSAAIAVHDSGAFVNREQRISVKVDWAALARGGGDSKSSPGWAVSLRPIEAVATLIKKSLDSTRVIVAVFEKVEGGSAVTESLVQSAIVSSLVGAKLVVQDPKELVDRVGGFEKLATMTDQEIKEKSRGLADIIVVGTATSQFSSVYAEPAIWHRARGLVRAVDLGSGQVIANIDIEQKGERPGIGPDKAGKLALKAVAQPVAAQLTSGVLKALNQ